MIRSLLRTIGVGADPGLVGSQPRSPRWPAVMKDFLRGKACSVCGATKGLTAHHVVPFHVDPTRELDPANLLAVCDHAPNATCHLEVAHLGDWRRWNPEIREHAATLLAARQAAIRRQKATPPGL